MCTELDIEGYSGASEAGGKFAKNCTLNLLEGRAAKVFAGLGLDIIGSKYRGLFLLGGKVPKVKKPYKSEKLGILHLLQKALGLKEEVIYDTKEVIKSLRYGKILIMTDQDFDGAHIKGLVIHFFNVFWLSLLQKRKFISDFITPIVTVTYTNGRVRPFYTMREYEASEEKFDDGTITKRYKGLACNSLQEAQNYFLNFSDHQRYFESKDDEDGKAIDMAFGKNVSIRSEWIMKFKPGAYLDHKGTTESIRYLDFISQELIVYFLEDLRRSLPYVVDGFKSVLRKILHCAFKGSKETPTNVFALIGSVYADTQYKHRPQFVWSHL